MIKKIGVNELERKSEIIRELINGEKATVLNYREICKPFYEIEYLIPKKNLVILDIPEGRMDDVELYLTEHTFEIRRPYCAEYETVKSPENIILVARKPCRYTDSEIKTFADRYSHLDEGAFVEGFKFASSLLTSD